MTRAKRRAWSSRGIVRSAFALAVVLFCAAPTPGDVGGCGQRVQPLDPTAFFERKKATDCKMCRECDFTTDFCKDACDEELEPKSEFLEGCEPIVHDGEVCLNALDAAGCGEYEEFVRDENRKAPNECRFCPWEAP
jgi:hypothetical protein